MRVITPGQTLVPSGYTATTVTAPSISEGDMTYPGTTADTARGPHQWLALVIGVVYLLIGVLGFFVTGFGDWLAHDLEHSLLGFTINGLHNVVHILIGVLGIALWKTSAGARTYGWILAIGYGLTSVYGLIVGGQETAANFLNINGADNGLHIVSTLAGLAIALWPARRGATTRTARA